MSNDRFRIWMSRASYTLWGGIALLVLVTSVPESPLAQGVRARQNVLSILPEGWGFFTKNPRQPWIAAHLDRGGNLERVNGVGSRAETWFGLRRVGRARHLELGAILQNVPEKQWRACKQTAEACNDPRVERVVLENPARQPTICGPVLLEQREPIPWAWSGTQKAYERTIATMRVQVSCTGAAALLPGGQS